ncbi:hypothetical protein AVEN_124590-1 [Araneus ventricosus]|uniref:Uncharacterized protein n=1 Tax=Araneus ventricosus TaxID=182803 RepID=A0A4Y2NVT6_ARAVE|nr:hypothetical protein AVEN_233457-1 [Araneus ventricosus]GBN43125.1 hypothetical protein AVEN_124590-1 [Araneus ventricosus]
MTRTAPGLAPPLQASAPHKREGVWPLRVIWRATGPIHGGLSAESGFEHATLRSRGRDLATRQLRPPQNIGGAVSVLKYIDNSWLSRVLFRFFSDLSGKC